LLTHIFCPQLTQAPPSPPQWLFDVPVKHALNTQQPAQLAGLHTQKPPLQTVPGPHGGPPPH